MASRFPPFVSTAEAAFLAGLDTSIINRLVDDRLVPAHLLLQEPGSRRMSRLGAAFARVYCDLENTLAPRARRDLVEELSRRIHALTGEQQQAILQLHALRSVNWIVMFHHVVVDVTPQVDDAAARAKEVDLADMLVTTDPEVMGGAPCFAGTRVPIDYVLASLDEGESLERLRASYSFLTEAHIDAARVYLLVRPRRGRPRKLSDRSPSMKPRMSKIVKPARQ
jgi:uncharacterized protein (DUF433 family)